jgi:hypothetical protein
MSTSLTTFALGLSLVAQTQKPDAMDLLRTANVVPNVALVLDSSCSMGDASGVTNCSWWATNFNGGNLNFNKNHAMRSSLVGCANASDGILDRWAPRVNFSVWHFGNTTARLAPFGSDLTALETAVRSVPVNGGTPMTFALRQAGAAFNAAFSGSSGGVCRPNYLLLLTDGDPNGGSGTFNFNCAVSGQPTTTWTVSAMEPWRGAEYMTTFRDFLCSVPGDQQIRTYTIGFGAPGTFNPTNLQRIANSGRGLYYYASNVSQLDNAFREIITAMTARSAVFFAAPNVQLDHLFSDNVAYAAAFAPLAQGPWQGNLKKLCVLPRQLANKRYDPSDRTCMFRSMDDGRTLISNPSAVDLWTSTSTTFVRVGGAGAVQLARLGTANTAPSGTLYPRNIVTWRPGQSGYVAVRAASWSSDDAFAHGLERNRLINRLHGYTAEANADGTPMRVDEWPLGDPVHAQPVLLRYGASCSVANSCWVVMASNRGLLHFFDAATGTESTALVPGEVWRPTGAAYDRLRQLEVQPDLDVSHRYYVDGGISLFHDDRNGDGRIQSNERATLVFGLGRGGAAYYALPMSSFNGTLSDTSNAIVPLTPRVGSPSAGLQDTWAAPWVGSMRLDGALTDVAVFASGHVRELDDPSQPMPSNVARKVELASSPTASACSTLMSSLSVAAAACGNWTNAGYADAAVQNVTFGPISVANTLAYRVRFSQFELDPNDSLTIEDSQGGVAATMTGAGPSGLVSPWVYDTRFQLRFRSNGARTSHRGFTISDVETLGPAASTSAAPDPSLYVVGLQAWTTSTPFASVPSAAATAVRITRSCASAAAGVSSGTCVDAGSSPDLTHLRCPISAEPAVVTGANTLKAVYFGDECGQLWRAAVNDDTGRAWSVKRLLSLNDAYDPATPVESRRLRKVFRRVDLVPSSCPGRTVLGVYFGTGNAQRPVATDDPVSTGGFTDGRDVVGVVWDAPDLSVNLRLSNLTDVTNVVSTDAKTDFASSRRGWYIRLQANERMLRNPLVYDGTALFKTFRPVSPASECSRASGEDAVYAVDNCSAAPTQVPSGVAATTAHRRVWAGATDIGGDFLVVTPRNAAPLITVANLLREESAALVNTQLARVPKIFQWREPKE